MEGNDSRDDLNAHKDRTVPPENGSKERFLSYLIKKLIRINAEIASLVEKSILEKIPAGQLKKNLSYLFSRYLSLKFIEFTLLICVALISTIFPAITYLELRENNRIIQQQVTWQINKDRVDSYIKAVMALSKNGGRVVEVSNGPKSRKGLLINNAVEYPLENFYLDELVSLNNYNSKMFPIRDLELSGLILPHTNKPVTIERSTFDGKLFSGWKFENYKIVNSSFTDIAIGNESYQDRVIDREFSEFNNIEIVGSQVFESNLASLRVSNSKLDIYLFTSKIVDGEFCSSKVALGFKNSEIHSTRFYCEILAKVPDWLYPLFDLVDIRTDLGTTNFYGAVLQDVDFSFADLSRTKGLDKATLVNVCGNHRTILPEGITLPKCK